MEQFGLATAEGLEERLGQVIGELGGLAIDEAMSALLAEHGIATVEELITKATTDLLDALPEIRSQVFTDLGISTGDLPKLREMSSKELRVELLDRQLERVPEIRNPRDYDMDSTKKTIRGVLGGSETA